ncbi:iron ABC transporter permease [Micromonospora sp. NPDC023966]|uniref:ABC transporter permease n=1 Tax=Micromonospora sp. NPDC023966 TaxID=3154699 RepID=UPI0034091975
MSTQSVVSIVAVLVVGYLTIVPLVTMLYSSLRSDFLGTTGTWTLEHYQRTLTDAAFRETLVTSLTYAGGVALASVTVGFALAWVYVRTNAPAKRFALVASLVPLIIPGILNTVAWGLLLAPDTGPVNVLLRYLGLPAFDLYSMHGMILVQSMHVAPIAFLMGVASLSSMDSSLEEAAAASGARPATVFRTITFPLIRPAVLGAIFLMLVQTMSSFEVPQLIGSAAHKRVFSTEIFTSLRSFPPDYGSVSVIGVIVLVIAVLGLWAARRLGGGVEGRGTITGKGYRPTLTDLGRWRWVAVLAIMVFFVVTTVLPMLILAWASLLPSYRPLDPAEIKHLTWGNYSELFNSSSILGAMTHSLEIALAAGVVVTAICAVSAYVIVRTQLPGRATLDAFAAVPIAVPNIILGVSTLYWYLVAPLPVRLYGTLAILVVAMVTHALPYGMRYLVPGVSQIKAELEEASLASGAGWARTFRRIYLPLLVPAITASFLYTFIISFRELSSAIFLYTQKTEVVSISVFELWSDGQFTVVSALGVVMTLMACVVIGAVNLLSRRFGVRTS